MKIREFEASLEKQGEIEGIAEHWGDPKQLVAGVDGVDILIVQVAPVTAEVIDAGKDLELIGCCRTGPANVDTAYATKKGIPVLYTPSRNAHGVADLTIGLIVAEARGIARADAEMKTGVYGVPEVGVELWGKTLGIIGLGNAGSAVAYRARNGFNMKVLAYGPYAPKDRAEELGLPFIKPDMQVRKVFLRLGLNDQKASLKEISDIQEELESELNGDEDGSETCCFQIAGRKILDACIDLLKRKGKIEG